MGNKSTRKKAFLRDHPLCCFCGGKTPSEELDHIPSRVLFDNRQWPEGYVFPACVRCNRETRYDEQIIALISRIYPGSSDQNRRLEFKKLLRAVAHNHPHIVKEMQATIRQKRKAAKQYKIEIPAGISHADLPLINLNNMHIQSAVHNFGRKLFLALYYKHTNSILPSNSGIFLNWYTNLQIQNGLFPFEINELLNNFPVLTRCNTSLFRQFYYKYSFTEDNKHAMFLVFFRMSFVITGIVSKEPEELEFTNNDALLRPYTH